MRNELMERSQQMKAAYDTKSQRSERKKKELLDIPKGYELEGENEDE